MATLNVPVTAKSDNGNGITLGELRLLVARCEGESNETVVRGTTFVEWSGNPRVKSLTVNIGETTP